MNIINLNCPDEGTVDYKLYLLAQKEVLFQLTKQLNSNESYLVVTSLNSPTAINLLLQVADILNRESVQWELYITYLSGHMFHRQLNVLSADYGKIVLEQLANIKPWSIKILDPIAPRTFTLRDYFGNAPSLITGVQLLDQVPHLEYTLLNNSQEHALHIEIKDDKVSISNPEILKEGDPVLIVASEVDAIDTLIKIKESIPDHDVHVLMSHITRGDIIEKLSKNFTKVYITDSCSPNVPDLSNVVVLKTFQK